MKENNTAKLLVELRKEKHLTQNDLAESLGVTYQAVSKWERGENLPDSMMLIDIAAFYGITVDELLNGKRINKKNLHTIKQRKAILMGIGIALLILSPISIWIFGVENYQLYVITILVMAAIGVLLIIYSSVSSESLKAIDNPRSTRDKHIQDGIYAVCVGIFLILGFMFGLWYIAWVVFIFGYAVVSLVGKKSEE